MIDTTAVPAPALTAVAPWTAADREDVWRVTLPVRPHPRASTAATVRVVRPGGLDATVVDDALTRSVELVDSGEVLVVDLLARHSPSPTVVELVSGCGRALSSRGAVLVVAAERDAAAELSAGGLLVRTTVAEAAEAAMSLLSVLPRRVDPIGL